ncbi:Ubiquitin carboxyl-terminal hydrolase 10 [Rhodosporidiobolus nylandii]
MAPATDYAKLRVADLKDILTSRSLPTSGLKADLVKRLQQADEALLASGDPATAGTADGAGTEEDEDEEREVETGQGKGEKRPAEDDAQTEDDGAKRMKVDSPPSPPPAAPAAPPSFDSAPSLPPPLGAPTQPIAAAALPASGAGADPADAQAAAQAEVEAAGEEEGKGGEEEEEEDTWVDYEALLKAEQEGKNGEAADGEAGRPKDLYLDTISRPLLDFDFERLCSVTLTHNHIYCCLVCGRYFSGRGRSTPAYAHSISEDHHVFISLDTSGVWVLPDGYEVHDASLADIQYALSPTFTPELVDKLDRNTTPHRDLAQKAYYPGFVGLNNMKANSFMNAILHSLAHVPPLRDYFLLTPLSSFPHPPSAAGPSELVKRFAEFVRKVWNPRLFKAQVSPHELLQEVGNRSEGRFRITEPGDPVEFLGWLMNTLHRDLGGTKKPRSSIIYSVFQGQLRVEDQAIVRQKVVDKAELREGGGVRFDLDRDIQASNIIPQVPLSQVLAKYDGLTTREEAASPSTPGERVVRRWKVEQLPPFVVCVYKRFLSNRFLEEKNPTIVNFPLRGVEMADYVDSTTPFGTVYDLVSNLTHSSTAGTAKAETAWKVHVHLRPPRTPSGELDAAKGVREEDERWFEVCDLDVAEVEKGLVPLGETYIQIWERRTPTGRHDDIKVEAPRGKKKAKEVGAKGEGKK